MRTTGAGGAETRSGARLLVLGRQGAGKGTQCARMAGWLDVPHISTGDLFRAEVAAGSPIGRRAESFLTRGALVPDDVVVELLGARLAAPEAARGYLLDGFPRTLDQGQALFAALGRSAVDGAIEIHVPTDVVLPRLVARRVCTSCGEVSTVTPGRRDEPRCATCGGTLERRADDTDEAIATRLALYDAQTGPLLIWLDSLGLLSTVDGTGAPDAVFAEMVAAVAELVPERLHVGGNDACLDVPGLADAG